MISSTPDLEHPPSSAFVDPIVDDIEILDSSRVESISPHAEPMEIETLDSLQP